MYPGFGMVGPQNPNLILKRLSTGESTTESDRLLRLSRKWTETEMKTLEILKSARKKIEKPENWTKHAFARDAEGGVLDEIWISFGACFCASGAIIAAGGELHQEAYNRVNNHMGLDTLSTFNDSHSHAEVLEMFDRAIAELEAN
jgi:hypothetical protein